MKKLTFGIVILAIFTGIFYYFFLTEDYHIDYDFYSRLDVFVSEFSKSIGEKGIRGNIQPQRFLSPESLEDELAFLIKVRTIQSLNNLKAITIVVDDKGRREIIDRIKAMGKDSIFFDNIDPYELLGKFKTLDYFLNGNYRLEENGKFIFLSISIKDTKAVQILQKTSDRLISPKYLLRLKRKRNVLYASSLTLTVLFGLYIIVFFILLILRQRIRRRGGEIIMQVEDLIEAKKFVAADGYIKYVLRYDPQNPHFHDLKTKLEALSFGNPRKAQIAYELYSKIKDSIDNEKISKIYTEVIEYKDYNPELNAICYEVEEKKKTNELLLPIRKLISEGRLKEAEAQINILQTENPEINISVIEAEIEENKQKGEELFKKVIESFSECKLNDAKNYLNETLKYNKDIPNLEELLSIVRGYRKIHLYPISNDKTITIFTKRKISIGRQEDNDIVISNPKVSRHHCRILISERSPIVEDLDSKNHTYIAGEKIKRQIIEHGDMLDIGRAEKFTCHIKKGSAELIESDKTLSNNSRKIMEIGGISLKSKNEEYILIASYFPKEKFEMKNVDGIVLVRGANLWMNNIRILENSFYPLIDGDFKADKKEYKVKIVR